VSAFAVSAMPRRACPGLDPGSRAGSGRAASFRHALPRVRGVPTLGVLCVIRLPTGIRRAFPLTGLLRLPVACSTAPLRFRHRAVSGFPLPCLKSRLPSSDAFPAQEPLGPPTCFDVSLPACPGLWTPAALHLLAHADALVSPSVRVNTLGVRHTRLAKLSQHFRACPGLDPGVRGHPYGLQDALSTLRPSCSPCATTAPPWTQDAIRVGGSLLPDRDSHPARYAKLFLAR
jgi:hypothetical protein